VGMGLGLILVEENRTVLKLKKLFRETKEFTAPFRNTLTSVNRS
jgi:hypothetical protein